MILSTLAELEQTPKEEEESLKKQNAPKKTILDQNNPSDEKKFLSSLKERILVLFEGLHSPNEKNLETRLDITLNFLEYLLAAIEERQQKIK